MPEPAASSSSAFNSVSEVDLDELLTTLSDEHHLVGDDQQQLASQQYFIDREFDTPSPSPSILLFEDLTEPSVALNEEFVSSSPSTSAPKITSIKKLVGPPTRKRQSSNARPIGTQQQLDVEDHEYQQKRRRNNEAVRRSRMKTRQRQSDCQQEVLKLRGDNDQLSRKLDSVKKELRLLRSLFVKMGHTVPSELSEALAMPSIDLDNVSDSDADW